MRISDWSSDVCSSDLAAWGRQGWGRWPARWARSRWGSKRWATRAGNVALTAAYPSRRELDRNGRLYGGEGGIRTHGTRKGTTVFETVPIDHSGTSPQERYPRVSAGVDVRAASNQIDTGPQAPEIGRASCRERVCQ